MNKKTIVPKDVAKAIEELRARGYSNWNVIDMAQGALYSEPDLTLKAWAFDGEMEGTPDKLIEALVNGYTVEQTPEEKVREYYMSVERLAKKAHLEADHESEWPLLDELLGIERTLDILGIKIEGVNA